MGTIGSMEWGNWVVWNWDNRVAWNGNKVARNGDKSVGQQCSGTRKAVHQDLQVVICYEAKLPEDIIRHTFHCEETATPTYLHVCAYTSSTLSFPLLPSPPPSP